MLIPTPPAKTISDPAPQRSTDGSQQAAHRKKTPSARTGCEPRPTPQRARIARRPPRTLQTGRSFFASFSPETTKLRFITIRGHAQGAACPLGPRSRPSSRPRLGLCRARGRRDRRCAFRAPRRRALKAHAPALSVPPPLAAADADSECMNPGTSVIILHYSIDQISARI